MRNELQIITERIGEFLPNLIGALIVLLVGWLIAKGIKALVVKLFKKTNWDEKGVRQISVYAAFWHNCLILCSCLLL